MATAVINSDGVVVNMIVAGPGFVLDGYTLIESVTAQIGWTYDGETFAPPVVPLADQKAALSASVDTFRDATLYGGFTVPSAVSTALAGKRLQTRDERDRTAWLTSQAAYQAAVITGNGDIAGAAFRPEDNVTITVSFGEGLAIMLAMAAWGHAVYSRSWDLKDAIADAVDGDALAAIDITVGWP